MSPATRASFALIGACSLWAFSFPIMKALAQMGSREVPAGSSVFFASLCTALRFSIAGVLLAAWLGRGWRQTRWLEVRQGGGIGFLGGLALVLQMDGMAYTLASTSAFLTQGYVVFIPLWLGLTRRRLPALPVLVACALSIGGAALLGWESGADPGIHFGRGEWETLAGSVLFAGQILWLERPEFAGNDSLRTTAIMFTVMILVAWPMAWATSPGSDAQALASAFRSPVAWALLAFLAIPCTLMTFPLANHWQPKVPATQAGLLYCTEPVFTTLVALWAPGLISVWARLEYPNETLPWNRLAGGGLILAANVLMMLRPPPPVPSRPAPSDARTPR